MVVNCIRRESQPFRDICLTTFIRHSVTPVTVLQFQNRWYEGQKLTLYLYINIEVFLGYGKTLSRTVTLKHCNATEKNRKKLVIYSYEHKGTVPL